MKTKKLTSLSEFPHRLQHLHSIHCQRYCLTEIIMLAVNCKHDGCPKNSTNVEVIDFIFAENNEVTNKKVKHT